MNDKLEKQKDMPLHPSLSQVGEETKQKATGDETVITICALVGGATFFIPNITTGVVPGGAIGGAIGGAAGAVVGIIISALRK